MMGYGGYNTNQNSQPQSNNDMQGGAGGGGFNTPSQNIFPFSSPGGGGGGDTKKINTLRPISILALVQGTSPFADAAIHVDGKELSQVIIVGRIMKKSILSNAVNYTIDDGTGICEIKKYSNDSAQDQENGNENAEAESFDEGTTIKVIGKIKLFKGKKSVDAVKISTMSSFDEVTHHLLSVCQVHLALTRPKPTKNANKASPFNAFTAHNSSHSPITAQILDIISQTESTEGIHVSDITFKLRGMASEEVIKFELQKMCNDGYAFESLDDHYRPTGQS